MSNSNETRVESRLVLSATDALSAPLQKSRKAVEDLGAAVDVAGKKARTANKDLDAVGSQKAGAVAPFRAIQETSGDVESALKGLGDFAGQSEKAVKGLGDAFGATEAVMRLMPGPAGLAAAALAGMALGAKLLYDHINQTEAKLRLLTTGVTRDLGERLGFSADETVRLAQALGNLGTVARPSTALLAEVAKNARDMGNDPADAVAKFVGAWKEGPDAVRAIQGEVGTLSVKVKSLPEVAEALGISAANAGLQTTLSTAERLKNLLGTASQDQTNLQAEQTKLAELQAKLSTVLVSDGGDRRESLILEIDAQAHAVELAQARVNVSRDQAQALDEQATREQQLAKLQKDTADAFAAADIKAQLANTKQQALKVRLAAIDDRRNALAAQQVVLQEQIANNAGDEARERLRALKVQQDANELAEKQALDADRQERAAKAKAAAQESQQRRMALLGSQLATEKARADRDGIVTEQERLRLLDLEVAKERAAASAIPNRKLRAAELTRIDEEAATKRAAIDRELNAARAATDEDLFKATEASMQRTVELQRQADAAMVSSAKVRATTMAAALRAQGQVEQAIEVERRQARAEYEQALIVADRDRLAALQTVVAGSVDAANVEALAESKRVEAKVALGEVERRLDEERATRARQNRADAADALQGTIDALQRLSQAGSWKADAAGKGLSTITAGLKDLDKALAQTENRASSAALSIGGTLASLGNVAVDVSTKRTLAALDADEKTRLSTAKTEQERAAITADFEKRKADAVEEGERRKAAILGLMEVARAAASYPNIPEMVAHGAAAALYGAIAGGAFSVSSPSSAAAPMEAGTSLGNAASGGGSGKGGGGGITNVININTPLVSRQDVGKGVTGSLRSLRNTGYAKSAGG